MTKNVEIPILYKDKAECCGCSACFAVCPVDAIYMKEDEEGFLYPYINNQVCIGCKKCLHVCAFKNDLRGKTYRLI